MADQPASPNTGRSGYGQNGSQISPPFITWAKSLFRRNPKKTLAAHGPSFDPIEVEFGGYYQASFTNRPQPNPGGAGTVAYDTLALVPRDLLDGGAILVKHPLRVLPEKPLSVDQAIPMAGIPLVAGSFWQQPLVDPRTGQQSAALPSGPNNNIPFPRGGL